MVVCDQVRESKIGVDNVLFCCRSKHPRTGIEYVQPRVKNGKTARPWVNGENGEIHSVKFI